MLHLDSNRLRRVLPLAALAVLAALALGPAASAQDSANITVTASVTDVDVVSLSLCATSVNFGQGLTPTGAAPTGTADNVVATSQGQNPLPGVYYRWTPPGQQLLDPSGWCIRVTSSVSWQLSTCASENQGTSYPSLTRGDLFWSPLNDQGNTAAAAFQSCTTPSTRQNTGNENIPIYLYLRVHDNVQNGTFEATVTLAVTPV